MCKLWRLGNAYMFKIAEDLPTPLAPSMQNIIKSFDRRGKHRFPITVQVLKELLNAFHSEYVVLRIICSHLSSDHRRVHWNMPSWWFVWKYFASRSSAYSYKHILQQSSFIVSQRESYFLFISTFLCSGDPKHLTTLVSLPPLFPLISSSVK